MLLLGALKNVHYKMLPYLSILGQNIAIFVFFPLKKTGEKIWHILLQASESFFFFLKKHSVHLSTPFCPGPGYCFQFPLSRVGAPKLLSRLSSFFQNRIQCLQRGR